MGYYSDDTPQINESWLLKNDLRKLFLLRCILLLFMSTIWWFQIYEHGAIDFLNIPFNFKYLTLIGVNLAALYFFLAVLDMIAFRKHQQTRQIGSIYEDTIFSKLWKVEHFAFQAGFSSSLAILLLFWTGDYPNLPEEDKNNLWSMLNNVLQHGVTFLIYVAEFSWNNIRFENRHLVPLGVLVVAYLIVNMVVTFADKPVYEVMDWKSVGSYVFMLAAIVIFFAQFTFARFLYNRKKAIRIDENQSNVPPESYYVQGLIVKKTSGLSTDSN